MSETTRVPVVDDDADALLLLRLILGSRPEYDAVFCNSPARALTLAPGRRFDVVVTDLHMSGMDGLQLAAALRTSDPTFPVLLVTAHATVDAAVRGAVTDFLTTPLLADAVCRAIDAARRLGARLVMGDLADTAIPDSGATITLIESVIREMRPDVVYVHSAHDVHRATLVAARGVPRLLCYQSPSATIDVRPSTFIPAEAGLDTKLHAIAAFESHTAIRDYMEPEVLTATARYWGRFARIRYAEPFEVVRSSPEVDRVLS